MRLDAEKPQPVECNMFPVTDDVDLTSSQMAIRQFMDNPSIAIECKY
jgi:hypothetical protein